MARLKKHLPKLSFLAGVAAGALGFLAVEKHSIAFVCFIVVWYALAYGVPKTLAHLDHRNVWLAHVVLFPVAWVVGVVGFEYLTGSLIAGVLVGGIAAVIVQAATTQLALRTVRADQRHDVRRRLGIE